MGEPGFAEGETDTMAASWQLYKVVSSARFTARRGWPGIREEGVCIALLELRQTLPACSFEVFLEFLGAPGAFPKGK